MGDLFERRAGATVKLVKGSGGVFEISVDGELRFSKKNAGRFPQDRELDSLLPAGT